MTCKHCGEIIGTNVDCVYCEHIMSDVTDGATSEDFEELNNEC